MKIRTKRDRVHVICAFHPSEMITNFCRNSSCLLPLCPKCIKIHVEEHNELNTAGKF